MCVFFLNSLICLKARPPRTQLSWSAPLDRVSFFQPGKMHFYCCRAEALTYTDRVTKPSYLSPILHSPSSFLKSHLFSHQCPSPPLRWYISPQFEHFLESHFFVNSHLPTWIKNVFSLANLSALILRTSKHKPKRAKEKFFLCDTALGKYKRSHGNVYIILLHYIWKTGFYG